MNAWAEEAVASSWSARTASSSASRRSVGLLIPRLCGLAALCLSALMVGAAVTNVAALHDSPLIPLCILLVSAVIARARWTRTVALIQR